MKLNWLAAFALLLSADLLAQQATDTAKPTSTPATTGAGVAATSTATNAVPATNAAKAPKKKSTSSGTHKAPAKKKDPAAELRTVPLVPGPAVVGANHVNVRGKPKLKGDIITRLNKGEPVTVLEEIVNNNSASDEPSAWAKIAMPTNVHVWVHSSYIDPTNKTVIPKKLNVRKGPSENYNVVGQLVQGETVTEVSSKDKWLEIQAPSNSFAFVASQFLKQEAPGTMVAQNTTEPPAEHAKVSEEAGVAAAASENPATAPGATNDLAAAAAAGTNELAMADTNAAPTEAAAEEPPPKRIVQREGLVRGTGSIQAPTSFGLYSIQNGRLINYLYTSSPNLDLRRYKGLHIIVTGEESLEERWGNTPMITIQMIQTLDE